MSMYVNYSPKVLNKVVVAILIYTNVHKYNELGDNNNQIKKKQK